jgi:O-antigen ligase
MVALATYVLFVGGAWIGIYSPDLRIITVGAAGAVLAVWILTASRDRTWRPQSVLMPAILACLGSLAISTVFSRYPRISLEYLAYAVLLAALYLLLVRLMADPFFRQRLVSLATVLFIVVSCTYIALCLVRWIEWWGVIGHFEFPPLRPGYESFMYGTPSTVMTVAVLLALPLLGTRPPTARLGPLLIAAVLTLLAFVSLLTGSRAGWLGIAIALAAVVMAGLAGGHIQARIRSVPLPAAVLVAVFAIEAAGAAVLFGPALIQRIEGGGESTRATFVRIGFELFSQAPIAGAGPGSWVIERVPLTRPNEIDEYIPHAHNLYVQTLAELGVIGLAAGIVVAASLVLLIRAAMRSSDGAVRQSAWVTLGGLVYLAAHQLLDFYPNMPAVLLAAAIPVAYLDASVTATRAPARLPTALRLPAGAAAVAAIAVAVAGLLYQEIPARHHASAVDRANQGDWSSADVSARQAAAEDPAMSPYLFTAGLTSSRAGDHTAAAAYFAEVARRDDFPEAWLNLAAEQAALGDRVGALASLGEAMHLGRQRPAISMPSGDLALRLGADEVAVDAFAAAFLANPSLAGDRWWISNTADHAYVHEQAIDRAMAALQPGVRWQLALTAGERDLAIELAADAADPARARLIIEAWDGDRDALGILTSQCEADARDVDRLLWCARLERRYGDVARAGAFTHIANVQFPGTYRSAGELRVDEDPRAAYPVLEGGASIAWGTYTYRRVTAWDVLVPGLLRLTVQ